MKIIPISRITINREGRQRRELVDIEILADSIQRHTSALPETGGLINPIVVTRDLILIAGERRLEAHKYLGRSDIAATFSDEIPEHVLRSLELEENVKRCDLSWQDMCKAVQDYHALRKVEDPSWTQEQTGTALGLTHASISSYLSVAEEIQNGNTRVLEAPKFSVARGIVQRKREREATSALSELRASVPSGISVQASVTGGNEAHDETPVNHLIENASFLEWAPSYSGPRFNFIHCDFPYGIDADKFNQGGAAAHGGYQDSEDYYWQLCRCLADNLDRIVTPSAHIMFWFSMKFYQETLDFFREATDFVVDPFPLIWSKSDNVGILPDPSRGPRRVYETAFHGYRGDRKVVQAVSNHYSSPSDRQDHMSTKPVPMLNHFFRMFVDANSIVLDPTCGSGSSIRAAEAAGAVYSRGLEINSEFADRASRALAVERAKRKLSNG